MNGNRKAILVGALALLSLTATSCKPKEKKEEVQQETSEKPSHIPPVVPQTPTVDREEISNSPTRPRKIKGPQSPAPATNVGLERTKWVLTELMGKDMESGGTEEIYLRFDGSGRVTGFNGCDSFEGTYEIKTGGRIEMDQMTGNPKPCANSGNAIPFNQMLHTIDNFTIKNGILRLHRSQMTTLLKFRASAEPST